MTPERWRRIPEVYSAVCDLPPGQQSQRLAELCAGDAELFEQVQRILRDDPSAGQAFVDKPPLGDALARFTTTDSVSRQVRCWPNGSPSCTTWAPAVCNQADAVARFRREITLARLPTVAVLWHRSLSTTSPSSARPGGHTQREYPAETSHLAIGSGTHPAGTPSSDYPGRTQPQAF